MKKAILFKKLVKGNVQCTACSHYCKVAKGKKGICGVRQNIDGELFLLVYGLAAAMHVDQMEKKPLYHFLPGTNILSFGTVGCNFRCDFCQNWDMSQVSKPPYNKIFGDEQSPEQIVSLAIQSKCPSIAYTYNEPGIFFEYAHDIMKLAHQKGIKNVYVSNGYISKEARIKLEGLLDAANIDLKSFNNKFYYKTCGAKLRPVLETIEDFYKMGVHIELTTMVIPGHNDSDEELQQIAKYIAEIDKKIPWHISRFFPNYKMEDTPVTPIETLKKAEKIGKKAGLKYIYIGNV